MIKLDPSRAYPTETESRVIIRFQDCDPLHHLNNAKYFDYYFNAREDQIAKMYDFSLGQLFRQCQASWVIYQHQIAYIRPARVSEWVLIRSRLIYFNEDTIVTEFYMTDDAGGELKNVLWSTQKYVSFVTGKRIPHDPIVMAFLEKIQQPGVDLHSLTFNDRIRNIKMKLPTPSVG